MSGRPHPLLADDYPTFATKPTNSRQVRRRAALIRECWTPAERERRMARTHTGEWSPPLVHSAIGVPADDAA